MSSIRYSQYCSFCYAIDPMSISDRCKTGALGGLSPAGRYLFPLNVRCKQRQVAQARRKWIKRNPQDFDRLPHLLAWSGINRQFWGRCVAGKRSGMGTAMTPFRVWDEAVCDRREQARQTSSVVSNTAARIERMCARLLCDRCKHLLRPDHCVQRHPELGHASRHADGA